MRSLADEMWAPAQGPQGELGAEHDPRPGIHAARRRAAVQPAERAAAGLHRHEGRQPAPADGPGTVMAQVPLLAGTAAGDLHVFGVSARSRPLHARVL